MMNYYFYFFLLVMVFVIDICGFIGDSIFYFYYKKLFWNKIDINFYIILLELIFRL